MAAGDALAVSSVAGPALWVGFVVAVLTLLALDLAVFHRHSHALSLKEAKAWNGFWVVLALTFNGGLWWFFGGEVALQFLTGYLLEKSLSIDNVFVFVVVLGSLEVPKAHRHKVLVWGVAGALAMRAVLIFTGVALLERFHWTIYVFGGALVVIALRLARSPVGETDPQRSILLRAFRRIVPTIDTYQGSRLWVRVDGRVRATPLLAVLVLLGGADLLFALGSLPAVFAVTTDPFLVFASNAGALLGLRCLTFVLTGLAERFRYLKSGIACALLFVGGKLLASGHYTLPTTISSGVIVAMLATAALLSLRADRRDQRAAAAAAAAAVPGR